MGSNHKKVEEKSASALFEANPDLQHYALIIIAEMIAKYIDSGVRPVTVRRLNAHGDILMRRKVQFRKARVADTHAV